MSIASRLGRTRRPHSARGTCARHYRSRLLVQAFCRSADGVGRELPRARGALWGQHGWGHAVHTDRLRGKGASVIGNAMNGNDTATVHVDPSADRGVWEGWGVSWVGCWLQSMMRPGRPRLITDERVEEVIIKTLKQTPGRDTHWSLGGRSGSRAGIRPACCPSRRTPVAGPPTRRDHRSVRRTGRAAPAGTPPPVRAAILGW